MRSGKYWNDLHPRRAPSLAAPFRGSPLLSLNLATLGNCTAAVAAEIVRTYPIGECVTDGAASRKAVSCTEILDYPNDNCKGDPYLIYSGP